MADDDTKNLNNADDSVEETQVDSPAQDQQDEVVDVARVEEESESSPEEQAEIAEELEQQPEMEMEDSSTSEPSAADEAAEEAVQAEVDAENEQTAEDLGEADERVSESANQSDNKVIPSEAEESDDNGAESTETDSDGATDEASDDAQTDDITPAVDENPNAKWYVVHTYSGHENRVATNLRQRIESEHLEHKIVDILVPTQDKIEIRGGKKEQVKEKVFPGYILVKMDLDNTAWIAVRTTQGVIGFVGAGTKPVPISDAEVKSIVQFMNQGAAPTFKEVFLVDDTVKIIDGPFADFIGKVDSVDKEKGKLRVLVSIFGRETPVELDFLQVSKL